MTSSDPLRVRLLDPVCGYWLGERGRLCGSADQVRPYLVGPRCRAHTPAALAGHPKPDEPTARVGGGSADGGGPAPLARGRA